MLILCLLIWSLTTVAVPFYIPTSNAQESRFLHIHANTCSGISTLGKQAAGSVPATRQGQREKSAVYEPGSPHPDCQQHGLGGPSLWNWEKCLLFRGHLVYSVLWQRPRLTVSGLHQRRPGAPHRPLLTACWQARRRPREERLVDRYTRPTLRRVCSWDTGRARLSFLSTSSASWVLLIQLVDPIFCQKCLP